MNIILCGYGKMGREVAQIAQIRSHDIIARIDPTDTQADTSTLHPHLLEKADLVIEFSHAEAVPNNIVQYQKAAIPAVIGTTGWNKEILKNVKKPLSAPILYGSNFSIGAHMMRILTQTLANMLNRNLEYDIAVYELHHNKKKDSPSGTALTLADTILNTLKRKKKIVKEPLQRQIAEDELHVIGIRNGSIPGTHQVSADSNADTLEIIHRARNRTGFALGSIKAAEWLLNKKPGIYRIEEYIENTIL